MRQLRLEREITGLPVTVDGYDWKGCTFTDCEIILSDGDLSMADCHFQGCWLTLSGKAEAIGKIIALFSQGRPIHFVGKGGSEGQ